MLESQSKAQKTRILA